MIRQDFVCFFAVFAVFCLFLLLNNWMRENGIEILPAIWYNHNGDLLDKRISMLEEGRFPPTGQRWLSASQGEVNGKKVC